jgi:electron transfer flavoprotein alpha subunit
MDVAGGLSAQLGLPQIGQCRHIATENGRLTFISQICGGKLLARGEFPNSTTLVTMVPGGFIPEAGHSAQPPRITTLNVPPLDELRIILKQYQEPDTTDVDITKEEVLIAVGRGLQNQDDLEPAEALANALGGVVCGSRPIIDQGWLPATRLVGKSGRRVKPGLYLALGISGAPEHVEAITGSELIVAINTDPAAPIFDIAQYGIVADMFDLLEPLLEQVQAAKKG